MENPNSLRHAIGPDPSWTIGEDHAYRIQKMLTQNLRKLESEGIVIRKDLSDLVLHIEYDLNERVRERVCALLDHLVEWGNFYLDVSRNDRS